MSALIWLIVPPAWAGGDALLETVCEAWPDPEPVSSAPEALAHAQTYHWWARETGNSVEMHCRAHHAYVDALRLSQASEADPDGPEKVQHRRAAEAGLSQVRWRVDNSFDTFRNIYPLAWWLLGDDRVVEPEDGPGVLPDFYSHAAEQAWWRLHGVLDDPERPRTPALIRCSGDPELCPGLREFTAILVDAHPRLATIPDDRGVALLGPRAWGVLTDGAQPSLPAAATADIAAALRSGTGFDEVLAIDLVVADTVRNPVDGVRVELAADVWSLSSGERRRLAASTGIGADLVPRRNLNLAWVGLVALLGVLLSPIRRIAQPLSLDEDAAALSLGQVLVGVLVGAALGGFAPRLTLPLAPGMEALALNPSGWPRLATLVWPLAHGSLLTVAPLLLSLFIVFGVMPRVNAALAERLDLGLLTLSIQAGALAVALAPIPVGEGVPGLLACAAMAAPVLAIAAILGERIEQIRAMVDIESSRQVVPIILSLLGLVLAFPFLLVHTPPALLFGSGCAVALLAGLLELPHRRVRPTVAPERPEAAAPVAVSGSLRRPAYVSLDGRDIVPIIETLSRPGVNIMAVCGSAGLGKTRLAEELIHALSPPWKVGHSEAEDPQLSENCVQPYASLGAALGAIFDQERVELSAIYARQVAVREMAVTAGDALDFLPGVGLLLGIGGGVNSAQLTLERLRRDIVRALRRRLRERPVLLIIDDLQWVDQSSLSLLEHILLALSHLPADALGHPLGVVLLYRPTEDYGMEDWVARLSARLVFEQRALEPLSSTGVDALLNSAGVRSRSGAFSEAVRRQVGGAPLNILSLIHELVEQGIGQSELVDGGYQIAIPLDLDDDRLQAVVPGQMADLVRQRLSRLQDEELLLLQGAAQCGRRFEARSLSSGFGIPRMDVLRRLRDIEDAHRLITDLDDDDHFRFDMAVTRSVLIEMMAKRHGRGQRELVKEFHHRVVGALLSASAGGDWSEDTDTARVVRHALLAGGRRSRSAAQFAVRAAQSAAKRFAHSEALRFIEVASDPSRRALLTEAEAASLTAIEARIRRAIGGQANRQRAIACFGELLGSPHIDQLSLVRDFFEAIFEEKQPADLTRLTTTIARVRASFRDQTLDPLIAAVCAFYETLNRTYLDGLRPPDATVAAHLGEQAAQLRVLADERVRDREQLLSWVLQAQATWTADGDAVVQLCEESLQLKARHNDLAGQALTKGVLANHYLFKRREPARARALLEADLQILGQMGARGQRSSVLNRIAMSEWLEAEQSTDAALAARLRDRALESAWKAYEAAVQTGRAGDLIFSAFAVLDYGSHQAQSTRVNRVGRALVERPAQGWPWPDADTFWATVPGWLKANKQQELSRIRSVLAPLEESPGWLEALADRLTAPSPQA
jgi:hypothetical protein